MKALGLKKKLGGALLGLAVVAVLPMATMTVKAEELIDFSCNTHSNWGHAYIKGVSDSTHYYTIFYELIEGKWIVGHVESLKSSFDESVEVGGYAIWKDDPINRFVKCDGKHIINLLDTSSDDKKDNDNHGSGSNDDSRPAPPSPHQLAQTSIYNSVDTQLAKIDASKDGQVIVDGKDLVNALPNTTMQKIAEKPNAVVFFTYTYNGAKYTTAIPGSSVDTSIEWYGPVYMMTHFPTMWHQDANTSVPVVAPVQ